MRLIENIKILLHDTIFPLIVILVVCDFVHGTILVYDWLVNVTKRSLNFVSESHTSRSQS